MIEIHTVAQERAAKHRFLNRAELLQRAVAAPVLQRRARFDPVNAKNIESEVEYELGGVHEDALAPEIGAEREAPFSDVEGGLQRPNLEETNDGIRILQHDAKRDRLALLHAGAGSTR